MAKLFWDIREEHELMEKLRASDPTGKWVSDFVHSDNPKFAGKSKKERIKMALGASYAAKRQNEDVDIDEAAWGQDKMANLKAAHDRHSEKAIAANRAGDDEAVKVHQSKMNMIKNQMNRLRKEDVEQVHEAKHRISVTVSEPDHPMVTKRKEQQQKFVRVSGEKEGAVSKAQQHFKKQGYKVHGAEYVGAVNEDIEQVDETPAYTKDDAYSSFGSIKPHRTLKIANVLKPEKDASARAERLMSKAGVRTNEAKSLYDRHQEIRKKSGLPDPSYYLKKMKEKQAEIEALRNQGDQGSTERLHGISHDAHPGAQKTFAGQVKK